MTNKDVYLKRKSWWHTEQQGRVVDTASQQSWHIHGIDKWNKAMPRQQAVRWLQSNQPTKWCWITSGTTSVWAQCPEHIYGNTMIQIDICRMQPFHMPHVFYAQINHKMIICDKKIACIDFIASCMNIIFNKLRQQWVKYVHTTSKIKSINAIFYHMLFLLVIYPLF